ncbi:DUF1015 domain-containing protein [bacterium]|nr:DUF1015 domain-containing protein [bacterium]
MAIIKPFRGIRYNKEKIQNLENVVSPPYDVIPEQEKRDYLNSSPYNIIRLILPESDGENDKYNSARNLLNQWLSSDIIKRDECLSIYIYQQIFSIDGEDIIRTGFICLLKLEEFKHGTILPHEKTLSAPKEDRLRLMNACKANLSQIFGLYQDTNHTISQILKKYTSDSPIIDITDIKGEKHKLWAVRDKNDIAAITSVLKNKKVFIADGHHRYETALNYKKKLAETNSAHTGNEPYNFIMTYLCEMNDSGLVVLPTHRLIKDLPAFRKEAFKQNLSTYFDVIQTNKKDLFKYMEKNKDKHVFGLYMGKGEFYALSLNKGFQPFVQENIPDAWKELDVAILHKVIIENILGITEEEVKSQKNIKYVSDKEEGIRQIDNGSYELLLFLNPTKLSQIKDISLKGEVMPQKSTYFYPKLLTGLVINQL